MDAVAYFKAFERMCDSFDSKNNIAGKPCVGCPLAVKTRQSEFLKMFPNARIESDGMPSICPIVVDKRCHNKDYDALFCLVRDEEECRKCRRDFWLAEISEGKACE